MSTAMRPPFGEGASPSARWCLCNSRDLQQVRSTKSCLAVGSPMGQRERDIWVGVPPVKLLWAHDSNLRRFCRQTATVERKDRVINSLIEGVRPTREDVVAA